MGEPPPRARELLGVDETTAPGLALDETAAEGPAARHSRADAADASTLDAGDPAALAALGRGAPVDEIGDTEVGAARSEPSGEAPVQVRRGRGADAPPVIEGFRVLEVLGRGGMGTVYAGEQDAPRRPVAIKVLHATSAAASARFWAEAEIMARLDHPGIAKVLEAGVADGHPYFVMERVVGQTLDAYVRAAPRPLRARLALFQQICDAVHHAHVKGVIHRDLKPSNVMVRDDGRVAVLDFGIARVASLDGASSGDTQAGELIGTPVYMSPEQARLRPDEVDARSDVYTLGVIFYELVSGELPYEVRGKALPDVARAICHDPPRSLGRRDPALRGDLTAIGDHALAKEPERRYRSAAALGDDVRRFLAGDTISVRAPGLAEQVRRAARRRPGAAIAIAAAALAVAAFAVVVTGLWLDARAARRQAEAERIAVAVARDALEERNNQLVLDRAAAAIAAIGAGQVVAVWTGGDEVAAASADGTVARWRVEPMGGTGAVALAPADPPIITGVALKTAGFAADGSFAILGGVDGRVVRVVIAPIPGRGAAIIGTHAAQVRAIAIDAAAPTIATGSDDGVLQIWSVASRRHLILRGHGQRVRELGFAPGGGVLWSGDSAGVVRRWDLARVPPTVLVGHGAPVERLAASPSGDALASVDGRGEVRVWATATGGGAPRGDHGGPVTGVAFAGSRVVTAGPDGTIAWWDLGDAAPALRVPAGAPVTALAASRDGRWVAAATAAGPIALHAGAGTRIARLAGHDGGTDAIAFSPDGALLASGGQDRVVRVWSIARPDAPPLVLGPIDDDTRAVVFAPAGDRLITAGDDGRIRAWTVRDGAIDPASFAIWAERRVGIRAVGIDPVPGRLDVSWRDGHAVSIDLAPPHAVHPRPPRPDEDAPWLALARPAPLDVTARGDAILVTPRQARPMAALRARVTDAIGAAAIAATATDRAPGPH